MKLKLDIVKNRFIFLALSACLLLPGIVAMIYSTITYPTHTPLKVGIDYTGGTTLQYGVKEDISNDKLGEVRSDLENGGIDVDTATALVVSTKKTSKIMAIFRAIRNLLFGGSKEHENN